MTDALIIRNDAALSVTFSPKAEELKESALAQAAMVGRVTDAEEQEAAVKAQCAIQWLVTNVEKARKLAKDPVLTFGRAIDLAAKTFVDELETEMTRISEKVGTFQQQELARKRAEEQAQNENLNQLERQKAEALVRCANEEQADAVTEFYNNKAAALSAPPAEPARADGQRIVNDWDIVVTDIHTLYRFHPNCCKVEPRLSEIKELLKQGVTPKGVTAKPTIKAGVRVGSTQKAIEI